MSKLLVIASLPLIASPWWQPIVQELASKHLGIDGRVLENANRGAAVSGWALLVLGIVLYIYRTKGSSSLDELNADLSVSILGADSVSGVMFAVPIQPRRFVEFPAIIEVKNDSSRSALDVEMFVRVSSHLGMKGAEVGFKSEFAKVRGQVTSEAGGYRSVVVESATIHPSQKFRLEYPLYLKESTFLNVVTPATTKDGVDVVVGAFMDLYFDFSVTVCSRHCRPVSKSVTVRVVDTSRASLGVTLSDANVELVAQHQERMAALSWWKRLSYRVSSHSLRVISVDRAQLKPDPELPIDRVDRSADISSANGARLEFGYFIPALGVGWSKSGSR